MNKYRRIRYRILATRVPEEITPATRDWISSELRKLGHREPEWVEEGLRLPNGSVVGPGEWVAEMPNKVLKRFRGDALRRKYERC